MGEETLLVKKRSYARGEYTVVPAGERLRELVERAAAGDRELAEAGLKPTTMSFVRAEFTETGTFEPREFIQLNVLDFARSPECGGGTCIVASPLGVAAAVNALRAVGARFRVEAEAPELRRALEEWSRSIGYEARLPELRPYQRAGVEEALRRHRVFLSYPTGSGKTVTAIAALARIGRPAVVVVPTEALRRQWLRVLERYGIPATAKPSAPEPVLVTTYQYLSRARTTEEVGKRAGWRPVLILDEAHHVPATTWMWPLILYPWMRVIGLSATPARSDVYGIESHLERVRMGLEDYLGIFKLIEVSYDDLVEQGYIVPVHVIPFGVTVSPLTPEGAAMLRELLRTSSESANTRSYKMKSTGVVEKYLAPVAAEAAARLAGQGRSVIVYASRLATISKLRELLGRHGIEAYELTGKRKEVERFRPGTVLLTTRAGVEGVDIPAADVLIAVTPPGGTTMMQLLGRIMRTAPGKQSGAALLLNVNAPSSYLLQRNRYAEALLELERLLLEGMPEGLREELGKALAEREELVLSTPSSARKTFWLAKQLASQHPRTFIRSTPDYIREALTGMTTVTPHRFLEMAWLPPLLGRAPSEVIALLDKLAENPYAIKRLLGEDEYSYA